jgi:hypothetical protein
MKCENCEGDMDYKPVGNRTRMSVKGKQTMTVCYKCFDYGLHVYNKWRKEKDAVG